MRKVFYYWYEAMLEDVVTVKTRIVKYIVYKLDKKISANGVHLRFQYSLIYFDQVIQDKISTFKAVGKAMQIVFQVYWKVIYPEILRFG